MDPILVIFKTGTSFAKACTNFILIKKLDELKKDIELIKGSFFCNALDFVEKAAVCENENNVRFFLESAYNNFSQSVKMYEDSIDQLITATTSLTVKESLVDSVKSEGVGAISRIYNKALDGVKDKVNVTDKTKVEKYAKENRLLEMSYVGKAMCEYYMNEYSICVKSIDNAIGVHIEPIIWLEDYVKAVFENNVFYHSINSIFLRLLLHTITECEDYFIAIKTIASEYSISIDQLEQRKRTVKLLQRNCDMGDIISLELLSKIN